MGALAKSKGEAGRPGFAITKPVLKKLEKLGASGLNQRWAAMALGISEDTFIRRRHDNADFAKAWNAGRKKLADEMVKRAPKVLDGIYKNATTKTEANPGGNVAAQSLFVSKVMGRTDGESQDTINLEELGGEATVGEGPGGDIAEIQEVRVRRIRVKRNTGRIEDGID